MQPHPHFEPTQKIEGYLEDLRLETKGKQNVLISSEIFSEKIEWSHFPKFEQIADQIKVIIYLRPQDRAIESLYAHGVKMGYFNMPFDRFDYERPFYNLDYAFTVNQWADQFGQENVIVRPFEKGQFEGGNIFSDFLSLLGVVLDQYFKLPPRHFNISWPRPELRYQRWLNKLSLDNTKTVHLFEKRVQGQIKNGTYWSSRFFTETEREAVRETFRAGNAEVAKKYLSRPNRKLFLGIQDSIHPRQYTVMGEKGLVEISRYILEEDPRVFRQIQEAIKAGLNSDKAWEQKISHKLQMATEEAKKESKSPSIQKIIAQWIKSFMFKGFSL